MNENNGLVVIGKQSVETKTDWTTAQGKKNFINKNKSNKYSDWTDKILWTYKDKIKIEDEIGIITMLENGKKSMSRMHLKYTKTA